MKLSKFAFLYFIFTLLLCKWGRWTVNCAQPFLHPLPLAQLLQYIPALLISQGACDGQYERRSSISLSSPASNPRLCTVLPASFPPSLSNMIIFLFLVFFQTFLSHLSSRTEQVACALLFFNQILLFKISLLCIPQHIKHLGLSLALMLIPCAA